MDMYKDAIQSALMCALIDSGVEVDTSKDVKFSLTKEIYDKVVSIVLDDFKTGRIPNIRNYSDRQLIVYVKTIVSNYFRRDAHV